LTESDIGDPLATAQFVVEPHFAQDWANLTVKVGISVNDDRKRVEVTDIVSERNERTAGELENVLHKKAPLESGLECSTVKTF
jgi:hypothetical protein